MKRRIFISMVADRILNDRQNEFKWAVVKCIEKLGFQVEIFYNPKKVEGIAARKSWTPLEAEDVIRQCVGGIIIGQPRWKFSHSGKEVLLPTEFAQYEAAVLKTVNIPIMVLIQEDMMQRGAFEYNFGQFICRFPENANSKWLRTADFQQAVQIWHADVRDRRDFFIGYCSSSAPTAVKIKRYLKGDLGASILDWRTDFSVGRTILEEIAEAAKRCTAGIFLFTKDDMFSDNRRKDFALPRDNVVFEAGYFIGLKGKRKVLIIREKGAKMPADLGGDIYADLEDRNNINPIKTTLKKFALGV